MPKPLSMEILNEDERIITAWASVECIDKDGEIIPMSELKKIMPILMDRGGFVMYKHTNKPIGKILNYEFKEHPETGKEGLFLTIKVFDDYDFDDKVWNEIKTGKLKGISFGGIAKKQSWKDLGNGNGARILEDIEGFEFSIVEEPANPYALIEEVNIVAKSNEILKVDSRYLTEDGRFKEMTCPDDPSKKSRFCGCVRAMMNEGYSLESAKRICGYIRYYVKKDFDEITKSELNEILEQINKETVDSDEIISRIYSKIARGEELTEEERKILAAYLAGVKDEKKGKEIQKPFAGFKDFDDCVRTMMEEQGYDEETARKVCGKIYWQTEGKKKQYSEEDELWLRNEGQEVLQYAENMFLNSIDYIDTKDELYELLESIEEEIKWKYNLSWSQVSLIMDELTSKYEDRIREIETNKQGYAEEVFEYAIELLEQGYSEEEVAWELVFRYNLDYDEALELVNQALSGRREFLMQLEKALKGNIDITKLQILANKYFVNDRDILLNDLQILKQNCCEDLKKSVIKSMIAYLK
ncbi:MAG: hypothetical protein DRN30_02735 [Thermoplasmata archaeon]|nr:MAG: hypothetical protein DRN30_02735 [Thermoplasmata archaeon]